MHIAKMNIFSQNASVFTRLGKIVVNFSMSRANKFGITKKPEWKESGLGHDVQKSHGGEPED